MRDSNTDGTLEDTLYYTYDANYNVTGLVNSQGSVAARYGYDPYGKVTFMNDSWDEISPTSYDDALFQGRPLDTETGLYDFRHRVYHPTLGRWLQRDPLGYVDGMGLYEALRGCPTVRLDPSGTDGAEYQGPEYHGDPRGYAWREWYEYRQKAEEERGKADEERRKGVTVVPGALYVKCSPSHAECSKEVRFSTPDDAPEGGWGTQASDYGFGAFEYTAPPDNAVVHQLQAEFILRWEEPLPRDTKVEGSVDFMEYDHWLNPDDPIASLPVSFIAPRGSCCCYVRSLSVVFDPKLFEQDPEDAEYGGVVKTTEPFPSRSHKPTARKAKAMPE